MVFRLYWSDFGGIHALLRSGYLWGACVLTALLFPLWSKAGWWEDVISVIPSISGFSLSAYAILVAFWKDRFYKLITTPVPGSFGGVRPSVYATTSAAFVHFIFVQLLALLAAIFAKAWHVPVMASFGKLLEHLGVSQSVFIGLTHVWWFFGYWAFVYALACGVAATTRVYMLAKWFGALAQSSDDAESQD